MVFEKPVNQRIDFLEDKIHDIMQKSSIEDYIELNSLLNILRRFWNDRRTGTIRFRFGKIYRSSKKMMAIYPNGFDINKIDKRIKNKLEELTNKYDSIQNPVQIRKINSSNRRRNRWMI